MLEVRYLDPSRDADVFREAWEWMESAPRWFRDCYNAWKETFEEQMDAAKGELNYGIFEGGEPSAIIRLAEARPWIFQTHLSARQRTPLDTLITGGRMVRNYLFDHGVKGFYGFVPAKNRSVICLFSSLGFMDTGVRCFKGTTHGKVIEWRQFALGKNQVANPETFNLE